MKKVIFIFTLLISIILIGCSSSQNNTKTEDNKVNEKIENTNQQELTLEERNKKLKIDKYNAILWIDVIKVKLDREEKEWYSMLNEQTVDYFKTEYKNLEKEKFEFPILIPYESKKLRDKINAERILHVEESINSIIVDESIKKDMIIIARDFYKLIDERINILKTINDVANKNESWYSDEKLVQKVRNSYQKTQNDVNRIYNLISIVKSKLDPNELFINLKDRDDLTEEEKFNISSNSIARMSIMFASVENIFNNKNEIGKDVDYDNLINSIDYDKIMR